MAKRGEFSRRAFLRAAGLAGAAGAAGITGAAGLLGGGLLSPRPVEALEPMPLRDFGRTGVKVPILALGMMFDTVNNQVVLRQSLALGAAYWDTADCYSGGNSEVGLGKYFERDPAARQKVFLVTKACAREPKGLSGLLGESLAKLKVDSIDLFFLHGVENVAAEVNAETKRWAEQMKKEGKIKLFGLSTHANMARCLSDAAKLGYMDGIMMTYNYRLMHDDAMNRAVDACVKAGIGLTAMKTQGGGPVRTDSAEELALAGRFVQKGFTPEQARLKAVWQDERIAAIASQMPSVELLRANAAAARDRTQLAAADLTALDAYAQATCDSYCAGCAALCEGALSGAVPVARVMRFLMYHQNYGETALARQLFAELPAGARERLAGLDYAPAEAVCPRKLAIGRLMRQAEGLLA